MLGSSSWLERPDKSGRSVVQLYPGPPSDSLAQVEELKVSLPRHTRRAHVAPDDFHVDCLVSGDDDGAKAAGLGKDPMVAFLASEREAIFLEDTAEPFPGDWSDAPFRLAGRLRWIGAHGLEGQSARSTRELRSDTQISRVAFWPTRTPPVEEPRPACRAQSSLPGTLGSRHAGCPGPFLWLAPG